ncbi:transposase family protein [Streptomyces sp. GMR22]|uniref:transposase family protein n=1 Tax=Streptomyces sp. GMR22 TaxID=2759524 RepID=UPI001F199CBB|nr:transposase family protein [Streptomyces sp. GMR22]
MHCSRTRPRLRSSFAALHDHCLVKLGPLGTDQIADLRPYFDSVSDPPARRGRWYSLTAILLVCACAAVSGARSIDELAEWGQRASNTLTDVDRDPPPPAQMAAHPVVGHNRPGTEGC